jgi:hypothetical protein
METTMKKRYSMISCVLLALLLSIPGKQAIAQNTDTLTVAWLDGNNLVVNSLYNAIVGDTLADGSRANANRVYKLEQGGFYYLTERLENNGFALRIVGEAGDPSDPLKNPPMIQIEHREDGSRTDKILAAGGPVELKNVIINGKTTLGDLPYEIMTFNATGSTYTIDNVIFEYAAWGILGFYGRGSEIYVHNSKFRNLHSTNQPWGGRGFSIWADMEKVHIENNTFFHIGGFAIQIEGGVANELWINQNTFVNVGRHPVLHGWHKNSFFTNNLIVNGWWHGEGSEGFNSIRLGQEDNQFSGMFYIDELPTRYGLEIERVVVVSNNSNYTDSEFDAFYQSTNGDEFPLRKQPFVNVRTLNYADEYDNIVIQNTFDGPNPGLTTYADNFSEMIAFITAIRNQAEVIPSYYWDPGRDNDNYSIQWPLPENLSYSNNTHRTAAIGGFPLGDLNWFPAQKEAWEAARADQEAQIRELAGAAPELVAAGFFEIEDGTVSGDAEVTMMEDRYAVRVAGGGEPFWEFNVETAGEYTVTVKHRTWYTDSNPGRQTNILVNGQNVGMVTLGMNITADLPWAFGKLEGVTLNAGVNKLTLGRSWGYMEYENVVISQGDNEIVTLYGSRADLNGADLVCTGVLCANGDAYVDMGTGSVDVSINVTNAGTYIASVRGLVLEGESASVDVSINGSSAGTITFTGGSDAFVTASLNGASMNAGSNVITFSNASGKIGLDSMNLFEVVTTSVEFEELPNGFALSQNYPNPFNPTTNISFVLPQASDVKLTVFNILGQQVAVLSQGMYSSGMHTVNFNAANLASGTYIYRLEAGNFVQVRKMLLLK